MKLVERKHGRDVPDPYRWLEDADTDEVQQWMTAQDSVARTHLQGTSARAELRARLTELAYVDAVSPPVRRGSRFFFSRSYADKEKPVYLYREGDDPAERVLLDANTLDDDGSIAVGATSPSRDGRWWAYSLSENNADAATLYVRDVASGEDSEIDVIPGARYAYPSWTPDNAGFYYVGLPTDPDIAPDEMPGRAELRYHRLGTSVSEDEVVVPASGDPTQFIGGQVSFDGHWLFLYKVRGSKTELYVQDLRSEKGRRKGFVPIVQGFEANYSIDAHADRFFVTTDEDAPNGRVFAVDPRRLEREAWSEIVPERDEPLQGAYVVGGHLVLSYLKHAHDVMEIHDLDGALVRNVELPGLGSTSGLIGRQDEDRAYFYYTSFTEPHQIYETSVSTGDTKLWASIEYPVDTSDFESEQVWYDSADGTRVSMFLIHRKGLELDGSNPTLLTGYGGFNVSMTPGFSTSIVTWVERGGVWALPNLRGGGEYGERWHEAGMLGNKQNVFDDFIAAAEYLVDQKYTRPEKLGIMGGSNGGLLVGAAMTQRPELFGAVVCSVPLLDMVRYHEFGSGRTWIPECGDPDVPEHFEWLFAYSPYHRVELGRRYPALLMMSADSDDRVDPMHARKFIAAIQAASTSNEPALLRIERHAGHGGADLRKARVEQAADWLAFLTEQLQASVP